MPLPIHQPQQSKGIEREPLQWLFVAEYADGSTVAQDNEDTCHSRTDGTGSAFSDVIHHEKEVKLTAFHLYHLNGKEAASVDLITGAFIINGTPVHIHNQYFEPEKYDLKLVYFRETRVDINKRAIVQDDLTVAEKIVGNPQHYVNRYFIGWETTVNGKNKQVTLAVG